MPECEKLKLQDRVRTTAISNGHQERAEDGHGSEAYSWSPCKSNNSNENEVSGSHSRLEEAVECYREALAYADPDYYVTPDYQGELAGVLAALDRDDESRKQFEEYLELLIQRPNGASELEIDVARYFLAQHLLKMRLPSEALTTIEPSLQRPHHPDDHLGPYRRAVRARALWQLGRLDEARQAAREAVSVESSEKTLENIRETLREILSD